MNFENDFPAAAATARDKMHSALSSARECTGDALARGEQYVRERPRTTLLSVFAIGLAVGVIVASATRPAPRRPTLTESLGDSKERLAELFGTVAAQLRDPLRKKVSSVSDKASSLLSDSLADALDKIPRKLRWW
jgi:ElaB/YqjD/DUF883 family membrane-anchored ribosome-binding protein